MFLHFWEVLKKLSKPQIRKKPFEVFYLFKNIILFSLAENRQVLWATQLVNLSKENFRKEEWLACQYIPFRLFPLPLMLSSQREGSWDNAVDKSHVPHPLAKYKYLYSFFRFEAVYSWFWLQTGFRKKHSIGLDTRKQMKGLFYRYVLRKNTVCMVAEKWSNLMADDKPEVSLHLHNVFQ